MRPTTTMSWSVTPSTVELLERLDLLQRADHDVDLAGAQASGEFAPGCDDNSQPEPGVLRVQAADHGGDQRRAAPRADTDAQLAEFQSPWPSGSRGRDRVRRRRAPVACRSSSSPMSVGSTPVGRRSNSGAPTSASNAWMLRDSAGWVMYDAAAARPKLPCSATEIRCWRRRNSIRQSCHTCMDMMIEMHWTHSSPTRMMGVDLSNDQETHAHRPRPSAHGRPSARTPPSASHRSRRTSAPR